MVAAQTCAAVDACGVFPADGRRRAEYTSAPGLDSSNGTSRGWVQCHLGRGICCSGGGSWSWSEVRPGQLCVLPPGGRGLDTLQKCGAVGEWGNARECRLGAASEMWFAASKSPSGWPARMTCTLGG
jgi:hypothetical protein